LALALEKRMSEFRSPEVLSYAPRQSCVARYRRGAFLVIFALLVTAICIGGRAGWRRYQVYRAERQRKLNQALIVAAFNGDPTEVRRLLAAGAASDARYGKPGGSTFEDKGGGRPMAAPEWTALIAVANSDRDQATELCRLEISTLLLDAHADPNLHDGHGGTALLWAVAEGHENLALLLLSRGAKADVSTTV
jgi:hypothetical protein